VPARDLPNAFSLTSIGFQTGAILGPALNGLILATLGVSYVYLFNAFSYLAVLLALLLMAPAAQPDVLPAGTVSNAQFSLGAIRDGLRFIKNQPIILSTMVLDFFATFFSSANTLMPVVAREILKVGPIGYGWLSAAQAIGAVAAALVVSQLDTIRRQGPVFLSSVLAFGLATVVFGLARGFALAMLSLVLIGASDSVSTIIRNTIRQLQTPDHLRGRMVSVNQMFFMGGPQLGEVESGLAAQLFGAPAAIVSGGIGCILATAWIARRWPQVRRYNGDEPMRAGAAGD
jgi:MFS family permease